VKRQPPVLVANSFGGKRLSSTASQTRPILLAVVSLMDSVASAKGLGSFGGSGSGWLAGGMTPAAPQAGAPPEFLHLPLWLGVQFVHGTPLRTHEHPTQQPLPLHRQHGGGMLASGLRRAEYLPTLHLLETAVAVSDGIIIFHAFQSPALMLQCH